VLFVLQRFDPQPVTVISACRLCPTAVHRLPQNIRDNRRITSVILCHLTTLTQASPRRPFIPGPAMPRL